MVVAMNSQPTFGPNTQASGNAPAMDISVNTIQQRSDLNDLRIIRAKHVPEINTRDPATGRLVSIDDLSRQILFQRHAKDLRIKVLQEDMREIRAGLRSKVESL